MIKSKPKGKKALSAQKLVILDYKFDLNILFRECLFMKNIIELVYKHLVDIKPLIQVLLKN